MDNFIMNFIANIVFQTKVEGTRRRGNPRTIWMSTMEERTEINLHRATYRDKLRTFSRSLKSDIHDSKRRDVI